MTTITFPDIPDTEDKALHTYLTDLQMLIKKNLEAPTGPTMDEITSKISSSMSTVIPSGVIVAWSGTIEDIPATWALCDGDNGTPDFRDKFIVAAGGSYAVTATGGSTSVTTTGTVSGTALTSAQMPSHSHRLIDSDGKYIKVRNSGFGTTYGIIYANGNSDNTSAWVYTEATGSSDTHTHNLTMNSTSILPPYYALAWIMKL